jgi:formylglycine-generating enzyme required for sulfatase activity
VALRDMAGNVAEWVFDAYGRYSAEAQTDPTGPVGGTLRVVRGGGLRDTRESIRTTVRFGADPADRSEGVGFRCVVPR